MPWPAGGYATWTGSNDDEDPNHALANMVQKWVNGSWPCYGVELRSIDPNATAGLCYASYSSLQVTYSLTDTNPPSTPQVLGDIDVNSHLHAIWTSSDQEGVIWQYQYAVGTSPGADNVFRWTTVPWTQTEVTNTSVVLTGGVTYYFSVKARDDSGNWTRLVSATGYTTMEPPSSTSARMARTLPAAETVGATLNSQLEQPLRRPVPVTRYG